MPASETLPLRIAAIFIIFVVSILGCLTPYLFIEGRKERDRRKQQRAQEEKDEGQRQQQQQQQQGAGGTNGGSAKPRKHKDHLESFHTTRAMHLLKAFSAGIVLSVGFVHVLADAQETLSEVTEYPLAPFVAMLGCITVMVLSQVVEGIVTSRRQARRNATAAAALGVTVPAAALAGANGGGAAGASQTVELGSLAVVDPTKKEHREALLAKLGDATSAHDHQHHQHHHSHGDNLSSAPGGQGTAESDASSVQGSLASSCLAPLDSDALVAMEAGRPGMSRSSSLDTPRNKSRSNSLTFLNSPRAGNPGAGGFNGGGGGSNYHRAPSARRRDLMERRQSSFQQHMQHGHSHGHHDAEHIVYSFKKESLVVAYLMEIGIVFHSILIGVGLGVIRDSVTEVKTLIAAVCVHQFFEGAGLATCILEAQLERSKNIIMFGLFSVTTSLGVAIGIGISSIYDPETTAAALLEGCFNALAAGVLVFLALVDMLAEEMHKAQVKKDRRLQGEMFACVLAGAGVMSILAVWA